MRGFCGSLLVLALANAASAQVTQRVSVGAGGVQGNHSSHGPFFTDDARYLVFSSNADNLVPGDTNGFEDVFVRDRVAGTTERVSLGPGGIQGNDRSYWCTMSADGRYVAFVSEATNLVPGDTNQVEDAFVRDRIAGTTERVNLGPGGVQANGFAWGPLISSDGRFVAFTSWASNLATNDTNFDIDAFVRDRVAGTTEVVSVGLSGISGNGFSGLTAMSSDGRFVVFESDADDLVPVDVNLDWDVFVRDRQSGTTELVSVDSTGVQGNALSASGSVSDDGRSVLFTSRATDLVPGDTNGAMDVFLRDRQLGTTERVSLGAGGVQGDGDSFTTLISATGRFVGFASDATNLVPGDANGHTDGFLRDRLTGSFHRVSVDSAGGEANGHSYLVDLSADGRRMGIWSLASDLVPADTNAQGDAFLRDVSGGPDWTSSCEPGIGGVIACPCSNPPAGPDRGCDNGAGTGGASLSASGGTSLSSDTLVFATSGERPMALSLLVQGDAPIAGGVVFGKGVRCAGGALERLFTRQASGGSITVPDFDAGDPTVSARSAAHGDAIAPGETRWYFVLYRDPGALGPCSAAVGFNATQTGAVVWSP